MTDSVTIVGVIGTEPKRIETANGAMVSFRLASAQRRYDRDAAKWVDGRTNWYSVNAFRELGKNALASFNRGDRVLVSGRLTVRPWESGPKSGTDVVVTAEALGHDLTWGTSNYTKTAHARESSATNAVASDEEQWASAGPSDDAGAWSPPALGLATSDGSLSLSSDETPF